MDRRERLRKLLGTPPAAPPEAGRKDGNSHPPSPQAGEIEVVETLIPLDEPWGRTSLPEAYPVHPRLLQVTRLTQPADGFGTIAFLDTETTGLAGGTGTLAFLVGVARFHPGDPQLLCRQFLMRSPAEEGILLEQVAEFLVPASLLVCFNGKSYDLPLLQTRATLNRMEGFPPPLPVLDLLAPSRRFFGSRLPACDLRTLERHVVGFHREGDIDGALIPGLYFQFLRSGERRLLDGVLEHNLWDLAGMVALLARLNRRLSENLPHDAEALDGYMRALLSQSDLGAFLEFFQNHREDILRMARGHARAGMAVGVLLKKSGEREEAYRLFLHLATHRPAECPESLEEVLIHEEHHLHDPELALRHCEEWLRELPPRLFEPTLRSALLHRRERLRGKVNRNRGATPPPSGID